MDRLQEIEIKRDFKKRYPDVGDRRIFYLGHPRVLNNPFYGKIRKHPDTIIDEGCGPGDDTLQFLKDGFRPIGVDMNESGFRMGLEWYEKDAERLRPLLRKGDVTRLDFPSGSFRYSYSGSLIHTLRTADGAKAYLSEVSRILAPGGMLFGGICGRDERETDYKHRNLLLFTRDELADLIEKSGMEVMRLEVGHVKAPDLTGYDFLHFKDPEDDIRLSFLAKKGR